VLPGSSVATAPHEQQPQAGLQRRSEQAMVKWLGRLFLEKPMAFELAVRRVELVGELRGSGNRSGSGRTRRSRPLETLREDRLRADR